MTRSASPIALATQLLIGGEGPPERMLDAVAAETVLSRDTSCAGWGAPECGKSPPPCESEDCTLPRRGTVKL
ncbi:MAG: hypothetical protein ACYCT1_06795 [Steroidobacteraceae bacterium]